MMHVCAITTNENMHEYACLSHALSGERSGHNPLNLYNHSEVSGATLSTNRKTCITRSD